MATRVRKWHSKLLHTLKAISKRGVKGYRGPQRVCDACYEASPLPIAAVGTDEEDEVVLFEVGSKRHSDL